MSWFLVFLCSVASWGLVLRFVWSTIVYCYSVRFGVYLLGAVSPEHVSIFYLRLVSYTLSLVEEGHIGSPCFVSTLLLVLNEPFVVGVLYQP